MSQCDCDNLDACLAGELSHDAASCFAAHLAACDDCRTVLDQQRWIDELLQSPMAAELEAPPAAVLRSFRVAVERRRRRKFVAAGLAAAAVLVIAVGWTVIALNRQTNEPGDVTLNRIAANRAADEPSPDPSQDGRGELVGSSNERGELFSAPNGTGGVEPRATFIGGPDVLVVPVVSRHPNVTIVQVYPVYQPEYAVQASAALPSVTDDFLWIDDLNDLNDLNGG